MNEEQHPSSDKLNAHDERALEAALRSVTPQPPKADWGQMKSLLGSQIDTGQHVGLEPDSSAAVKWSHGFVGLVGLAAGMLLMWGIQSAVVSKGMPSSETGLGLKPTSMQELNSSVAHATGISEAPLPESLAAGDLTPRVANTQWRSPRQTQERIRQISTVRNDVQNESVLSAGQHLVATRLESTRSIGLKESTFLDSQFGDGSAISTGAPAPTPAALMQEILADGGFL